MCVRSYVVIEFVDYSVCRDAEIKSGIENPPRTASYGKLCMIDTGSFGAGFGGGAGINGTLEKGKDAIYPISNLRDFRSFVKGGLAWLLGQPIFFPDGFSSIGASEIQYVRACTTTPSEITFDFGDADSDGVVDMALTVSRVACCRSWAWRTQC